MHNRKVIFTTGIRSDFYIQNPIIKAVSDHPSLESQIIITGAHLFKEYGYTAEEVRKEGHNIVAEINSLEVSDDPASRIKGAANQLHELIRVIEKEKPDFIISPYDREESITTALAGVYMNIPVAHLGAGDRTRVNVDGIIRHSVTKLAHIMFCSTEENAHRIIKMGEENFRVHIVGHTALERYKTIASLTKKEIETFLGLSILGKPLIVVIQHPVSNWIEKTREHMLITLSAIDKLEYPTVIIRPNSDPGEGAIKSVLENYRFKHNSQVKVFNSIPELYFVNILRKASVLVGNSSMGVAEAPMLKLPVVNVGLRQKDRQNAGNIIFVPHIKNKIVNAVYKCLNDENFKVKLKTLKNPYKSGAGQKIAKILAEIDIDKKLLNKRITY